MKITDEKGGEMLDFDQERGSRKDEALVALARAGSQEAFGELVNRHYQSCVNIATYMLRDRGEAQDEVQKACYKAFLHLDQYHGEAEFLTWMIRIVVNQCLMLIRVKRRTRFLYIDAERDRERSGPIELPAGDPDPEEEVILHELNAVLQREIHRIPPLLRNVLVLRDVQELPISDVAEKLNITVPAAKSRLLRARLELKDRVMRHCGTSRHGTAAGSLSAKPGRRFAVLH